MGVSGTNIFAGTEYGVFCSIDSGTNWVEVNTGLPAIAPVISLDTLGTTLFAGTYGYGVFFTTDNGNSWTTSSIDATPSYVSAFAVVGTNIFVGSLEGSVFLSTDTDAYWTDEAGWPNPYPIVTSLAVSGTTLFAGTDFGVWRRPLSDFNYIGRRREWNLPNFPTTLSIFPNPASGNLQIMGAQPGEIHLFDLMGRERMNAVTAGTGATLDVSNLEDGIYFLRSGSESAKVEIAH